MGTCILFSGGQDSTIALAWALQSLPSPHVCLYLQYGPQQQAEMKAAVRVFQKLKLPDSEIVSLGLPNLAAQWFPSGNTFEESFVPGRNLWFIATAAAFAASRRMTHIVTGILQVTDADYPDCKDAFLSSMRRSIQLAVDPTPIDLINPLRGMTKAETFVFAERLGVLPTVLEDTLTCHRGVTRMNAWGQGCAECVACVVRAEGWREYEKGKR